MHPLFKTQINSGFKKYFYNTTWLLLTQGLRLFVGFFVGLWLARYLAPANYGIYNYVISLVTFLMAFSRFGTDDILVKNILLVDEKYENQLNDTFYLRILLSIISIASVTIFYFISPDYADTTSYLLICSFALIFQSLEVIDLYYRAVVQIKFSSVLRIIQILISSALKVYFIIEKAPLIIFFYIFVLDSITYGIPIYLTYRKKYKDFLFKKPNFSRIKSLAKSSFPIMASSVILIGLSKVEQFTLLHFLGETEVGIYVSAYKIVELSQIGATLIFTSLFTAIINAKKTNQKEYYLRFQKLSSLLVLAGIFYAALLFIFSEQIIHFLYGSTYKSATSVLKILSFHSVTLIFMLTNIRWFIAENLNRIVLFKVTGAFICNLGLNILLIPHLGTNGAALSTLISHLIFFYFIDFFFKHTRKAFFINSSLLLRRK